MFGQLNGIPYQNRNFRYLLNRYYYLIFAFGLLVIAILTSYQPGVNLDYKIYLFILSFASFTVRSDIRQDAKWIPFIALAIPLFFAIEYLNSNGYTLWGKLLSWEITKNIIIDLNPIFKQIPFNDASFMRIFHPELLTKIMRLVYQNGFVIPALVPIYRAIIAKDLAKAVQYILSAHVLQVFLITPFYLLFHLQEVWFVLGHPDGMARNLSLPQAAGVTLNSFPSMHTSIAFAMFLLVIKEKNTLFKWVWSIFCLSVIFSTMYLEIHWVLDVLGGMLLAYATVKIVEFILKKMTVILNSWRIYLYTPGEHPAVTSSQFGAYGR